MEDNNDIESIIYLFIYLFTYLFQIWQVRSLQQLAQWGVGLPPK